MTSKVSPIEIIGGHLSTLKDDISGKVSFGDWLLFYGLPIGAGGIAVYSGQLTINEVFSGSASVFGIFVGLLLNVQVAIFAIFQRKPESTDDATARQVVKLQMERRAVVLRELNANVAYLVLICSLAIAICVVFLGLSHNSAWFTGILVGIYVHVILSLMMTVKRAFLLFDAEYQSP